jgi:hypothetical protein
VKERVEVGLRFGLGGDLQVELVTALGIVPRLFLAEVGNEPAGNRLGAHHEVEGERIAEREARRPEPRARAVGQERPQVTHQLVVGSRPLECEPRAVHERLHAAQERWRVRALQDLSDLGDGAIRQRLDRPGESRQAAAPLPRRPKSIGDRERVANPPHIVPPRQDQEPEAEVGVGTGGPRQIAHLHDRNAVTAKRPGEHAARAKYARRALAEVRAQRLRERQPLIGKVGRPPHQLVGTGTGPDEQGLFDGEFCQSHGLILAAPGRQE